MKSRFAPAALGFLCGLCVFLCMTATVVRQAVLDPALMNEGFLNYARTERFSVRAAQYPEYAQAITDYLAGKADGMRVPDENGGMKDAFSEKENLHMADVRGLIGLLRLIRVLTGAAALLTAAWLWFMTGKGWDAAAAMKGAGLGAALCLVLGAVLTAVALSGFDAFFVGFHRLFFRNDLWLLNPERHLLINLMPTAFFVWYGGEILKKLLPLAALALVAAVAAVCLAKMNEKRPPAPESERPAERTNGSEGPGPS